MASFHLELTDQRGSQFFGPFSGATVIGAHSELCQVSLPAYMLENRHAELRPTQVAHQLTLGPCTTGSVVYLWRQGRPWLLAQPCVIQHGERFSLMTPDGPTFRVLAMADSAAAYVPTATTSSDAPRLKTRIFTGVGVLLGLALVVGLALEVKDEPPAPEPKESPAPSGPKKPPQITPNMDREFERNSSGDPAKEMDRWAEISGSNNYRSARIHSLKQLRYVKRKHGIKRIVNLAMDSMSPQKDAARNCGGLSRPCEPIWAEKLKLDYLPVYLGNRPPSDEDWEKIQEYLRQGDTLVHCTHGVDRTGAVVGKWQHLADPQLTETELLDYTYHFGGQWKLHGDPNRHLRAWMVEGLGQ